MSQDTCFLLPESWAPAADAPRISVRRTAAMGDCIAATVVADRLIEYGHTVMFACHHTFHPILKLHPRLAGLKDQHFFADITLDGAYESHPQRRTRTFADLFVDLANAQLAPRGIRLEAKNCTPRLKRPKEPPLGYARPLVGICPRANGFWKGRHVPNWIWEKAMPQINGTCLWLGEDPGPKGGVDAHCRSIELLVHLVASLDLLVTVDTGPLWLASAMGIPVVAIEQASSPRFHLTDQQDWALVPCALECANCCVNICPINATTPPCQEVDPDLIAAITNERLQIFNPSRVAAVIPVWKPKLDLLQRCLEAVLPQVDEVVITADAAGNVPRETFGPQVRVVTTMRGGIGVGRNLNHGVRFTNAPWIVLLNDDVVLAPDAVARMKEVAVAHEKVGAVGQRLLYPDGTLYHASKARRADGSIGHPHVDYRKHRHTITEPLEVENSNAASLLVNRKAFYDIGGFDERVWIFVEDDILCMDLRRAGYHVWYTPHASGVHWEHAESKQLPDLNQRMQVSNAFFANLYGDYFRWNKGNGGLGNFGYLNHNQAHCLR